MIKRQKMPPRHQITKFHKTLISIVNNLVGFGVLKFWWREKRFLTVLNNKKVLQ